MLEVQGKGQKLVTVHIRLTNLRLRLQSVYPPLISAPFYGYLKVVKVTRKGKKSKQGF